MDGLKFANQNKVIQDLSTKVLAEVTKSLFAATTYYAKRHNVETSKTFPDIFDKFSTAPSSDYINLYLEANAYAHHITDNAVTKTETIPYEQPVKPKLTEIDKKICEEEKNKTEDSKGKTTGVLAGLACVVTSPTFLAIVGVGVVLGGAYYIWKKTSESRASEQNLPAPSNSRNQSNGNRQTDEPPSSSTQRSNSSRNSFTGDGGNDQQPPSQNTRKTSNTEDNTHFDHFLSILTQIIGVPIYSLNQVRIRGQHVFQNLNRAQRNYLRKLIKALKEKGILKRVLETILKIFNTEELENVNFVNFLSWAEFIINYLEENENRINELFQDERDCSDMYNDRRQAIIEIAGTQIPQHEYTILRVFREIQSQIEERILTINFRDTHSAVSHYYKHRIVNGHELQVPQYYDMIQENLDLIMERIEYRNLLEHGAPLRYTRYYAEFGRRLMIVLKKNGQRIVLSTFYFINEEYDDKDGDI